MDPTDAILGATPYADDEPMNATEEDVFRELIPLPQSPFVGDLSDLGVGCDFQPHPEVPDTFPGRHGLMDSPVARPYTSDHIAAERPYTGAGNAQTHLQTPTVGLPGHHLVEDDHSDQDGDDHSDQDGGGSPSLIGLASDVLDKEPFRFDGSGDLDATGSAKAAIRARRSSNRDVAKMVRRLPGELEALDRSWAEKDSQQLPVLTAGLRPSSGGACGVAEPVPALTLRHLAADSLDFAGFYGTRPEGSPATPKGIAAPIHSTGGIRSRLEAGVKRPRSETLSHGAAAAGGAGVPAVKRVRA